jgi:hypothetical protein
MLSTGVHTKNKKREALIFASKGLGLEVYADNRTWSCLEITMPEEVTISRLMIAPFLG